MGFSPFHFETKLHDEVRKWIGKQRGFYDCGYLPLTCLQSRVTKSSTAPQVCLAVVFSSGAVTEAIQPVAAYPAKCKLVRHPGISFISDRFTAGSLKSMSALVHRREGNGPAGLMGHPSQAPETILKHPKTMKVKADHHRKSNCKKGLLFKHVETINQLHIGFLLENYIYPVGVNPCAFRSNEIERKRRDRLASAGTAPEADGKHWTTTTTRTTTTTTTTTTTNNNNNNKQQPTNKKQQTTNNKPQTTTITNLVYFLASSCPIAKFHGDSQNQACYSARPPGCDKS